jgi:hypothetical protein
MAIQAPLVPIQARPVCDLPKRTDHKKSGEAKRPKTNVQFVPPTFLPAPFLYDRDEFPPIPIVADVTTWSFSPQPAPSDSPLMFPRDSPNSDTGFKLL